MDNNEIEGELNRRLQERLRITSRPDGLEPDLWTELVNWQEMGLSVLGTALQAAIMTIIREEVDPLPSVVKYSIWLESNAALAYDDEFTARYINDRLPLAQISRPSEDEVLDVVLSIAFINLAADAHPQSWENDDVPMP